MKKGERITLEADAAENPDAVYDLLEKIGKSIPLNMYNITQVALAGAEIAALLIAIDHVKTGTGDERQAAKRTSTHVPSDSLGQ